MSQFSSHAHEERKFITTEPFGKDGEEGEQKVWDGVRLAFADRECFGYWRYPIFSKTGEKRKEPDILIVDQQWGIIVIEVKSLYIGQIHAIDGHVWQVSNYFSSEISPYAQAENHLFAILGWCDQEPAIRRKVSGKVLIALPCIHQKEWQSQGFDRLPSSPPILFQNSLGKMSLCACITDASYVVDGKVLTSEQWEIVRSTISGNPLHRKMPVQTKAGTQTKASVLQALSQKIYEFDLQQEHIAKEIPPGPQRIRGRRFLKNKLPV